MRAVACLILWAGCVCAQPERWVATWGTAQTMAAAAPRPVAAGVAARPAAQVSRGGPGRRFPVPPQLGPVKNQTIRMVVRTSVAGKALRVRLSNAVNAATLRIGAASVARRERGMETVAGSERRLTFSGKGDAVIYGGQVLVSDPVAMDVAALSDLAVSLYLPEETPTATSHWFSLQTTYVSGEGDFTAARSFEAVKKMESYYWLAGVDVAAEAGAGVVVAFGDSITDGDQSTMDANGAWPSVLAARLQKNKATRRVAMVNAGIAGNRVLGERGALARMSHDVLSQPGVKWVMWMEGINDISGGAGAADLIAGYSQVIALAHLHGLKVIGCTLTPFGGSPVWTEAREAVRAEVNAWVRAAGHFDAVVDFDKVVRDERDPKRFRAEADSPDLLHPGDAGYRLMGEAVDLRLFR